MKNWYSLRRFGNRGQVLFLMGLIWVILGYGNIADPNPRLPDEPVPLWLLGILFVAAGSVALVASVFRSLDDLAWPLMIIPPAASTALFIWWDITTPVPNAGRGVVIYLALSLMLHRCAAGLDRCPPFVMPPEEDE